MGYLPQKLLEKKLIALIEEDAAFGDVTSHLIPNKHIKAHITAKEAAILSGIEFCEILCQLFHIQTHSKYLDGTPINKGDTVLEMRGLSRDILLIERTALNLLMRLSGITTYTQSLVKLVKDAGLNIKIAATRKTTPGFRFFEKYAVEIGGGDTHRMNLSDTVLIKENHLKISKDVNIDNILRIAFEKTSFSKKIEIEVENLKEFQIAFAYKPDIIMLDDFSIEMIQKALKSLEKLSIESRPLIEVSGGISDKNLKNYLINGIDIISIGSLTHSVKSIDFSLKIIPE